jgi:N-acetylneuraminic acid mutarotase
LLTACQHDVTLEVGQWKTCSPIPEPVAAHCCFSYDSDIYIFGGRRNDGTYTNRLWKYNIHEDKWVSIQDVPLQARVSSSACVSGDCVYIGLGYTGPLYQNKGYLRDFWAFYPATGKWKRLADFPANNTVKNCFFATDSAIYAAYGFHRQFTQDVYRYDIATDQWTKLETAQPLSIPRAMDVVGTTWNNRHFLGTGFNHGSLRFWAEWQPQTQEWVPLKKIKGAGRNAAACCATDKYIYLVGGEHYGDTLTTGYLYSSIQRYTPSLDTWEFVTSMPEAAANCAVAGIQSQLFVGMGETSDGTIQNNWYKLED